MHLGLIVQAMLHSALASPEEPGTWIVADRADRPAVADSLVGTASPFATGIMARRVLQGGTGYAYLGRLEATGRPSSGDVATPYRIGVDGWSYLLANDLLERLVHTGHANQVLSLSGRVLDIGGVRFAVIESYAVVKPPAEVNP